MIAKGILFVIDNVLNFIWSKNSYKKIGIPLTASERNFYNSYRLYASSLGITTNIDVSENELEEENWTDVFEDFYSNYPEVAKRFDL
ncbi:MAG: hypothetical protein VR72_17785 [Clostridiaceae bacterium BRH_c20a]|nr:MAG: hypothetical protein VR72_17785 [Clostridiaceae bacterium BRH_c20a]